MLRESSGARFSGWIIFLIQMPHGLLDRIKDIHHLVEADHFESVIDLPAQAHAEQATSQFLDFAVGADQ